MRAKKVVTYCLTYEVRYGGVWATRQEEDLSKEDALEIARYYADDRAGDVRNITLWKRKTKLVCKAMWNVERGRGGRSVMKIGRAPVITRREQVYPPPRKPSSNSGRRKQCRCERRDTC